MTEYTWRIRPSTEYTQWDRTLSTDYSSRPKNTLWIDYLLDHLWNRIQDEEWDDIIIYSDSWYEEINSWTQRTWRTQI